MSDTDYSSEDLKLLDNLAEHAAAAVRVALLIRDQQTDLREKERIRNELRVAQLIQRQLVPKDLPRIAGWEFFAHYHPAREVGGDFYDFIELSDGRLLIVAGDVTGKGIPAALVMASTRSILRGEASRLGDPSTILGCANDPLRPDIPTYMFVTCFCALLDPRTGRLVYANAGHNLPYLRTATEVKELRARGMPLGIMPESVYDRGETTLAAGESIVFHSDGLAEAHDADKEMFGLSRMKAIIGSSSRPGLVIESLLGGLRKFTGDGWEQEDDITLVVVHRMNDRVSRPTPTPEGSRERPRALVPLALFPLALFPHRGPGARV
jgi:serine phosphatase RsbU (regulator of sigma subunit)